MKRMKKLLAALITTMLLVPCFSLLAYAAQGTIMFTDPETATGEEVTVTGVVKTAGPKIGDANVVMKYDPTALQFVSGDKVTKQEDGKLVYDAKGTGAEVEHRFNMVFKALKVGDTKIEIESYTAYLFSDETLNCDRGSSAIKIAQGTKPVESEETPVAGTATGEGASIEVGGKSYKLSSTFEEKDMPLDFVRGELDYAGTAYQVAVQETSGVKLGYLVDESGVGKFFVYNEDKAAFAPFEQITVSDTTSIILLDDTKAIQLPDTYKEVKFTIEQSGNEFPAWQDTAAEGRYIVYAVNSQGTKSLYSYDKAEGTYQRFEAPAVTKEKTGNTIIDKAKEFVKEHLTYVMIGAAAALLLLLLILIVVGVKLRNRNLELDELYDEMELDLEEPASAPKKQKEPKEKKAAFASKKDKRDEEYFEDELEEDDFEEDYDDEYEDEDYDDVEEEEEEAPRSKRSAKDVYDDDDDDFRIDFIDLDD